MALQLGTKRRQILREKSPTLRGSTNRYADICIMVKDDKGKAKMLRALLDSGCSKSIILREFTSKSRRRILDEKDHVRYKTYGGYFTSSAVASVPFKLIEFNTYKDKLINYKFQVDSVTFFCSCKFQFLF